MKNFKRIFCCLACAFLLAASRNPESPQIWKDDRLDENGFLHPDRAYYPETWFHFIGGNVSKAGITADLEAIAAAKISGIQLFHGQFGGPWPGVSPQIACLSESWDDLIAWTASECKRLHLRFTMQNCPGWSYAGGPWITPSNAMRNLVQSRTDIHGGEAIHVKLEKPAPSKEEWRDYKDLFVLAFPTPDGDTGKPMEPVSITPTLPANLPANIVQPTVIQVDFGKETLVRTVEFPPIDSYSHAWVYTPAVHINVFADVDGISQKIIDWDMPPANWQDDQPITIPCADTRARHFRVEIVNQHPMKLAGIRFYSAAHQQNYESEAAWTLRRIVRKDFPKQSEQSWLPAGNVLNLTGKMNGNGELSWQAPKGHWTILRIGHVNTGLKNGPAPAEATGWESNKLAKSGVQANFNGYIGRLLQNGGALAGDQLNGILLDSWECKTQTWTAGLDTIFAGKQGYSLLSRMPALFGYVVDQPETTARFLRDWRVTLNDLLVENFFGEMRNIAHQRGLQVSFETASGDSFPGDILEYFKYADVPMCEFWQPAKDSHVGSDEFKPFRPTVSAAHVYGKKRVAAESFTSFALTWDEQPRFLKTYADHAFANGVSHLVFHTYTHNPRTDFLPPGSSFGSDIGTPFLRLQTWWQHMPYFTDYLARCGYMLERGRPVADVLLYLGDEQNHKPRQSLPFPKGYAYDYCNMDVLLNRLTVQNGQLVTPEGVAFRALWLYDCYRMLPETLKKIHSLVSQGAIVVGRPPAHLATLRGGPAATQQFKASVKALWGPGNTAVRRIGKGKLYRDDLLAALQQEHITPDVQVSDTAVHWLHRQTADADIYFVSLTQGKAFRGPITFRSEGYAEIWDPLTGSTKALGMGKRSSGDSISVDLDAGSSQFVVFRKEPHKQAETVRKLISETALSSGWEVSFPQGWGFSAPVRLDSLAPWSTFSTNPEAQHFSGTATYKRQVTIHPQPEATYLLDLGDVEAIAKVNINGKEVDTKWTYPYRMDISSYLKEGNNELQISVTSTWFNRLVYDAGLPEDKRKTWTINGPDKDSVLKKYGLLGPVVLRQLSKDSFH